MQADELLNIINECDVLREDIDEIRDRIQLTRAEGGKLEQAVSLVSKAKSILTGLFPAIKSLDENVREDVQAELEDMAD